MPQPVTMQRLHELFQIVRAQNCDPRNPTDTCIPYLYVSSGCAARAHEACRLLAGAGAEPEKIWLRHYREHIPTENDFTCETRFSYHVGAVVWAISDVVGPLRFVIDLTYFPDRPATEFEWATRLHANLAELSYTGPEIYDGDPEFGTGRTDPDYLLTNRVNGENRHNLNLIARNPEGPPPYAACRR
jgi:hypothetical protein